MKPPVETGDILIAPITLQDGNFMQSVVLICEHDQERGSYGLILNRPIHTVPGFLREFPGIENNLFQGGPVRTEVMQVLHPYGELLPGSLELLSGVWMGGDAEILQVGLESGQFVADECRFLLGYAGWSQGQLNAEFEVDAWLVARADTELVLRTPPEIMWSRAIRRLSQSHPIFGNFPDQPGNN